MSESIRLPRVLLTNDDGIGAPGIQILAEAAEAFAEEVWIVAPEHEQSGASQSVSLCRPVRVWPRGERMWAVDGSPCDCVALALSHFMAELPPSLVLSGVNSGPNAGDDSNTSGTVGAALLALTLGVPAIAISQSHAARDKTPWDTTREILPKVLRILLQHGWRKETCLSVNIPDKPASEITGLSWARQGHKNVTGYSAKRRVSPRHEDYFWLAVERKQPPSFPNSDIAILRRGEVAVAALSLDRSVNIAKPSLAFNEPGDLNIDD
ncbi:MAG: 5'/3'-nucleotidase SurE [Alphaproteobacteria bacterium]|nr:5'/3'-nucleotidase SurE [Alphaproteobacteria bacterium]